MAYIKGQPGHFFFEVRDLETGALFPGCTFSKTIVYVDGNTDINTSTSPSFDAWSTLNASRSECIISGSASGLWSVSIPTLPNDCETLTFHFIPTSGLNVHVPLVTISLENAPAESVDISGLATSAELESVRHELSAGISGSSQKIDLIPYYVWNYAIPSNISSSYAGGYLMNMYASVNSIQQDIPSTSGIAAAVWSETQRTLTSAYISDSVWLATKDHVADAREYILTQCKTASGFATPADVNSAKDEILAQCATATGFATAESVEMLEYAVTNCATSNELISAKEELRQCIESAANDIPLEVWNYGEDTTLESYPTSQRVLSGDPALAKIHALLGNWSVSGNVLTTYDTSGNALSVYSLTRDADGNITRVG